MRATSDDGADVGVNIDIGDWSGRGSAMFVPMCAQVCSGGIKRQGREEGGISETEIKRGRRRGGEAFNPSLTYERSW